MARNIEQLEAAINDRLAELRKSKDKSGEEERLNHILVEIKDALYHKDIHRLAQIGRKYGKEF